jgi:hypothetical protein
MNYKETKVVCELHTKHCCQVFDTLKSHCMSHKAFAVFGFLACSSLPDSFLEHAHGTAKQLFNAQVLLESTEYQPCTPSAYYQLCESTHAPYMGTMSPSSRTTGVHERQPKHDGAMVTM